MTSVNPHEHGASVLLMSVDVAVDCLRTFVAVGSVQSRDGHDDVRLAG